MAFGTALSAMSAARSAFDIHLENFVIWPKRAKTEPLHRRSEKSENIRLYGVCHVHCAAVVADEQVAVLDDRRRFQQIGFSGEIQNVGVFCAFLNVIA